MTNILRNPRLIRSSLVLLFFAVLFIAPMPGQQTTPVNQESNQPLKPDPGSQTSAPVTPEKIREAKIEADTKKLYQLSAELRAEVAKTYKESLSLSVLTKAEEIEKLARSLKALMNQEAAAKR